MVTPCSSFSRWRPFDGQYRPAWLHRVVASAVRAQGLCESRGGRPELPIPDSPYGLCGHKVTLSLNFSRSGRFDGQ